MNAPATLFEEADWQSELMWARVGKFDARTAALADRHYSRRKVGSPQFMPPGQTIILHRPAAVFGWWRPDPASGIEQRSDR